MMLIDFINSLTDSPPIFLLLLIVLSIWTIVWKGLALWKSATLRQKYWFIALLVVNFLGILEIIYLLFIAKNYKVEVITESETDAPL